MNSKFLKPFLFFITSCWLLATSYEAFPEPNQPKDDLEFTIDINAPTTPLPNIFKPNIDLSGRGFHRDVDWPQTAAAREAIEKWQKEIGFNGIFRLQYNLWEIKQLSKNKDLQHRLLVNYENIIRNISEAGGIVILNIFGTPAGMGEVLDKKSPPWDFKVFKELVKADIRYLSCFKKYNIWYEVWNAPDLDDFFLGRRQEYFNLYRAVASAVKELELETKIHIPVGGPSVSAWFQNVDSNTVVTPEKSLIYELIKFCYRYRLPLDFISWHGFSTSSFAEKENSIYNKPVIKLIRDWLSYFNFPRDTPLVIDEWNYDRSANVLPERKEKSFIAASFIPSRIKNMYEAGIDNQIYFCLEDFQSNKEGIVRNVGIFSFDPEHSTYRGSPKAIYNVFKVLNNLGNSIISAKLEDEFVGLIPTKDKDYISILIYNYIDPEIATNYLSKNISTLNSSERKFLLNIIKSEDFEKIIQGASDVSILRTTNKVKSLLKKTQELAQKAKKFESASRNIKLTIKNLKEDYVYQIYKIDSSCSLNCEFSPSQEQEIKQTDSYQQDLSLKPYSVFLIIWKKKPLPPQTQAPEGTVPTATNAVSPAPAVNSPVKNVDTKTKEHE